MSYSKFVSISTGSRIVQPVDYDDDDDVKFVDAEYLQGIIDWVL